MTIDLTNPQHANWMVEGRKRHLRKIDRGEADPDDYDEEYLAKLRKGYSDCASENVDEETLEAVGEEVSKYAAKNAFEIVAEIAAMKMDGRPISDRMEALYAELAGPEVPHFS